MKYKTILIDPPWTYEKSGGTKSSRGLAKSFYPTMTLNEIAKLKLPLDTNSVILLWTTSSKLPEALELIKRWELEYFNVAFTWIKKNKKSDSLFWGMGYYTRQNPEYLLLARRGKVIPRSKKVHSVIVAKVRDHSRKPDEQYERIQELFYPPYLEMFARTKRKGWYSWGNEVESDVDLAPSK